MSDKAFTPQQEQFLKELRGNAMWESILETLRDREPDIRSWNTHKERVDTGEHYAYQSGQRDRHRLILQLLEVRDD